MHLKQTSAVYPTNTFYLAVTAKGDDDAIVISDPEYYCPATPQLPLFHMVQLANTHPAVVSAEFPVFCQKCVHPAAISAVAGETA